MSKEAVILLAGQGTRLKPLTLTRHKCLTEVHGIPILVNALSILEHQNFQKATLVVGYLANQIREYIGESFGKLKVEYVENDKYAMTNTSYSLHRGLERMNSSDDIYILEGDVFFEQKLLDDLETFNGNNVTVVQAYDESLDGTFVELFEDFVVDWTHKSEREPNYSVEDKYKTVNIHKFKHGFLEQYVIPELEKSIEMFEGKEPLENVMRNIVRENPNKIKGMVLHGQKWFEIDDVKDLQIAEKMFAKYEK